MSCLLKFLTQSIWGQLKNIFLVELVILVSVRGSCSRGRIALHRQLRQLLTIRLKKKKKYRGSAMRFASSAHEAVSKDNRTGSKVLALLRETLRSHGNESSRKRLSFSLPGSPHGSLSFDFPRFPAEQVASFPTSRLFNIEIWLPLLVPTFYTFNMTSNLIFNLHIAL